MSAADVIAAEKAVTDVFDFVRGTTAAFPGGFEEKVMAAFNASHQQDRIKTSEINRNKTDTEFVQVIGLLTECRRVLHELKSYDADFYRNNCDGLIEAIGAHLPKESEK